MSGNFVTFVINLQLMKRVAIIYLALLCLCPYVAMAQTKQQIKDAKRQAKALQEQGWVSDSHRTIESYLIEFAQLEVENDVYIGRADECANDRIAKNSARRDAMRSCVEEATMEFVGSGEELEERSADDFTQAVSSGFEGRIADGFHLKFVIYKRQQGKVSCQAFCYVARDEVERAREGAYNEARGAQPQQPSSVASEPGGVTQQLQPQGGGVAPAEVDNEPSLRSCDKRVKVEVLGCERNINTVLLTYRITNIGLGDIEQWGIHPPRLGTIVTGGYRTVIYDDMGNEYPDSMFTFRDRSASASTLLSSQLPMNIPCKGTISLSNVPAEAKSISVILGVFVYWPNNCNLADTRILFNNIPISE